MLSAGKAGVKAATGVTQAVLSVRGDAGLEAWPHVSWSSESSITACVRKPFTMARFKVVAQTPPNAAAGQTAGRFEAEMEALSPIDAEIVSVSYDSEDGFIAAARDADAVIAGSVRLTAGMIHGLERCRVISTGSVGTDKIDVDAATHRGIPVTNCPDTFIEEVADHAMTLILATNRRLTMLDSMARDGRWKEGRPHLNSFPRLLGQTLGLISFGHVARAVAERAAPFGLRLLAHDPYVEELVMKRYGVEPVGLVELLQRSDFVSMHAPGVNETSRMLTEEHFRLMKPTALFFNTGRGGSVEEPALTRALQEKWIAGAGLDVLEQEPPDLENPLLHMDNVILTPHVASASARMDPVRRRRVGQEIALVLTGRWPRACVNPSVLDKTDLRRWQPYSMERGPAR